MARATQFPQWLNAMMGSRRMSQADVARAVGVADAQVSRWRRGQVVPTVHHLQRIADALEVPRAELDRLAGYPVDDEAAGPTEGGAAGDPAQQAELRAHQAWYGALLQERVPRPLWRAYVEACEALARSLVASYEAALHTVDEAAHASASHDAVPARRKGPIGFQP